MQRESVVSQKKLFVFKRECRGMSTKSDKEKNWIERKMCAHALRNR